MNTLEHLAITIKKLRTDAKLTQDGLATKLGVATNTVSRWETGTYKPDIEDLEKIARYFKVSVLAFFPSEDPSTRPELQALLRAAGNLNDSDLEELQRYAEFRRAQHMYKDVKTPRAKRVRQ
jgi:transcriptional regulator with XRE-family HTH domain